MHTKFFKSQFLMMIFRGSPRPGSIRSSHLLRTLLELNVDIVTVVHNTRGCVWNRRPTEREESLKLRLGGNIESNAWYWRQVRSNLLPGCLWLLWLSTYTVIPELPIIISIKEEVSSDTIRGQSERRKNIPALHFTCSGNSFKGKW